MVKSRLLIYERKRLSLEILLMIAVALFAGLMMTRVMNIFHLPDVTAYLIAGVLIGPCVLGQLGVPGLGFTDFESVDQLGLISDVALGFIAFAIGHEFSLSALKQTGKQAVVIGILQAVITTVVVDIVLVGIHMLRPDMLSLPVAITLGAIAAATAPAATLMVVRQYKAHGPVTDVLLPVVALDDAVGLAIFAVSFGAAQSMQNASSDVLSLIVEPLFEIVFSLALGALVGMILTWIEKYFHSNRNRIALITGSLILTVALSQITFNIGRFHVGFSSLLVCMMLGTVFCNACPLSDELMNSADKWSNPILILFFVLSGAALQFQVFGSLSVIIIGVVYIIARSLGKYFGAKISANIAKSPETVRKYLGITLLPQAGVALGMCTTAARVLGEDGNLIRNIILFAVLIYELIGPTLTKIALTQAGDITEKPGDVVNRRRMKLEEAEKNRN